jgi:hypothetical protein
MRRFQGNSNSASNPDPTFFHTGSARQPYNHGQWGNGLRATPPPWVMLQMARACRHPLRSCAHGFQPRWPFRNVSYCRIKAK